MDDIDYEKVVGGCCSCITAILALVGLVAIVLWAVHHVRIV